MKWGWPICSRAPDTIADTGLIGREQRLQYLNMFRAQFAGGEFSRRPCRPFRPDCCRTNRLG